MQSNFRKRPHHHPPPFSARVVAGGGGMRGWRRPHHPHGNLFKKKKKKEKEKKITNRQIAQNYKRTHARTCKLVMQIRRSVDSHVNCVRKAITTREVKIENTLSSPSPPPTSRPPTTQRHPARKNARGRQVGLTLHPPSPGLRPSPS